jgi:hypothetical protein
LELRNTWQRRSSPLREAEPGAMGHLAVPKPTSTGRRGPELRNAWWRRSSTQQGDEVQGHRPCGNTRAHLCKEVRSGAAGHMVAPERTSVGRCGPKLELAWQREDARPAPCLDLELVCGGTRSLGCQYTHVQNILFTLEENVIHRRSKPEGPSTASNPHQFELPTDSPRRHHQKKEADHHLHT